MMLLRIVALFSTLLLLSACGEKQTEIHNERFLAMGTLVDISLYGVEEEKQRLAIQKLTLLFDKLDKRWHAWDPSPLTQINQQLHAGKTAQLPTEMQPLFKQAQQLSLSSQGLFNPAIGELIALWGFHSDDLPTTPPAEKAIQTLLAHKNRMSDIHLKTTEISSNNPNIHFDFGAIAKGYAVDEAIKTLQQLGIKNAIVNAGGDLRAIGHPEDRLWRIGIRAPRRQGIIASLSVHEGESVFTSGDYERFFDYQGQRYHHIIDPRSGKPADNCQSVTVITDNAALADAAATALFIAGGDHWLEIARSMKLDQVMLIDKQGTVHITPAMQKRLKFEGPTP
ncbi:MAG: FAD:protein FMN transferase, partial [Gammaproteobacteria bacterium]|nr:FAD:protein FMN transferase [Gammaproteobacteria bacterium]